MEEQNHIPVCQDPQIHLHQMGAAERHACLRQWQTSISMDLLRTGQPQIIFDTADCLRPYQATSNLCSLQDLVN